MYVPMGEVTMSFQASTSGGVKSSYPTSSTNVKTTTKATLICPPGQTPVAGRCEPQLIAIPGLTVTPQKSVRAATAAPLPSAPVFTRTATTAAPPVQEAGMSNWLLIGGIVAALAGVGLWLTKKKGS